MLVTFEGLPGCGKKAHIEELAKKLRAQGYDPVVTTGEPGWNTEWSGILKYMATEGKTNPIEKLFLFLADRAGHFEKFIDPLLRRGYGYPNSGRTVILCDGGPDSTLAYQGFGANLAPIPFIAEANRIATQGIPINATFVLDTSMENILERAEPYKRKKYQSYNVDLLNRIRLGYSEIAKTEPNRVIMINNNDAFAKVNDQMMGLIIARFR